MYIELNLYTYIYIESSTLVYCLYFRCMLRQLAVDNHGNMVVMETIVIIDTYRLTTSLFEDNSIELIKSLQN